MRASRHCIRGNQCAATPIGLEPRPDPYERAVPHRPSRISAMPFNERSKHITQGVARSPNRAMYYALGYTKADFDKPMIGIANGHSTITPCNAGLQPLADAAI